MYYLSFFQDNEGPLPLISSKSNKCGESALHVAIKKGDYEKSKNLINQSDAGVNMKDNAGEFFIQQYCQSTGYSFNHSILLNILQLVNWIFDNMSRV